VVAGEERECEDVGQQHEHERNEQNGYNRRRTGDA
jgi:hypothetical protein